MKRLCLFCGTRKYLSPSDIQQIFYTHWADIVWPHTHTIDEIRKIALCWDNWSLLNVIEINVLFSHFYTLQLYTPTIRRPVDRCSSSRITWTKRCYLPSVILIVHRRLLDYNQNYTSKQFLLIITLYSIFLNEIFVIVFKKVRRLA